MELKDELKVDEGASAKKESGTKTKEMHEKSMHCTSNFEDRSFEVEDPVNDHCGIDALDRKEALDVNIVECTDISDHEVVSGCKDDTDGYSSSFSGTLCEPGTGAVLNDEEVDSPMFADTSLPFYLRKKRLTDHWRRFVRPIMWRCKWLELKMKGVQSLAEKYDKERKEYYQAKQFALDNLRSEGLGTKSLPLLYQTQTNRIMKRKKRKRVEETTNIQSYMLSHSLFSYYEYRKSFSDGALFNDNSHNLDNRTKNAKDERVFDEESLSLGFREGDEYLEHVLLRIEAAKLEARNLKSRVDKVLSEFPRKFSSVNTLSLPGSAEAFTCIDQKPPLLLENKDENPVKSLSVSFQHNIPGDNTKDSLMSENVVSSPADEKPIPDKRTTLNMEQSSIGGPSGNARGKRKSHNRKAKEEITQRPRVSSERPKMNAPTSKLKVPKRKRKWGKRRSASAAIRRRS